MRIASPFVVLVAGLLAGGGMAAEARPFAGVGPDAGGLVHLVRSQRGWHESHRDAVLRHQSYRVTRGYHWTHRRARY